MSNLDPTGLDPLDIDLVKIHATDLTEKELLYHLSLRVAELGLLSYRGSLSHLPSAARTNAAVDELLTCVQLLTAELKEVPEDSR